MDAGMTSAAAIDHGDMDLTSDASTDYAKTPQPSRTLPLRTESEESNGPRQSEEDVGAPGRRADRSRVAADARRGRQPVGAVPVPVFPDRARKGAGAVRHRLQCEDHRRRGRVLG